jgi:uncharacterized protein (DUF1501 family)
MLVSRRSLFKSAAISAIAAASPLGLRMAFGAQAGAPTLVFLLLRGGMDGLNLVAPSNDSNLAAARPATLYPANGGSAPGLPLANGPGGFDWRMHANATGLKALYDAGQLAIVHAAGIPASSRSHFQMQAFLEHGVVDQISLNNANGWIARYGLATGLGSGQFALLSSDDTTPPSMSGAPLAVSMPDPKQFNVGSNNRAAFLQAAYANAPGAIGASGRTALSTVASFAKLSAGFTVPPAGTYGTDDLSKALSVVAEVIKLNAGLQVAEAEFSAWDTHVNQQPRFAASVTTLNAGISNFMKDMNASGNKVTMVVMSEFGRRVKSNASAGTDHGHGNVMMVIGNNGVKGGRIYGQWLGLSPTVLDLGDVPVTTDYRSVLSEVITKTRGDLPGTLFPGYAPVAPLGLL